MKRKERVAELVSAWERGRTCAERSFHRYHSTLGDEVEIFEECLECGWPRANDRAGVPHIETWDDADHQPSSVKCDVEGRKTAQAAQNEVVLLASMAQAAAELRRLRP